MSHKRRREHWVLHIIYQIKQKYFKFISISFCSMNQQFISMQQPTEPQQVQSKTQRKPLLTLEEALNSKGHSHGVYNTYNIIHDQDQDYLKYTSLLSKLFEQQTIQELLNFQQYFELKSIKQSRGIASMLGCGIADALGASTQFIPFVKDRHHLIKEGFKEIEAKIDKGILYARGRVGVWTDDCSMALCLADSILAKNFQFDPIDLRYRFMLWLDFGLNNGGRPYSIGLGGNISISMHEFQKQQNPYTAQDDKFNNGNGSVMRLCPAAIGYTDDVNKAMEVAGKQSKTTHNGDQASQCCRLLAKIIVDQINRPSDQQPKSQLQKSCLQFVSTNKSVQFLSKSEVQTQQHFDNLSNQNSKFKKFNKSPIRDRNWDWKNQDFTYSSFRTKSQPGYIGSYCMDAMSMALYIVYHTKSFYQAVLWAVNMGGDCDSVGSVVGQIAGAMYGLDSSLLKLYSEMEDSKQKRFHLFIKGYKLINKIGVSQPEKSS